LYRAVDSAGNTLDFMLSAKRDGKAATRFFRKVLKAQRTQTPRVINVDKNAAYPVAIETLKGDEKLAQIIELRQLKYLNNGVEQDHRNIKRITKQMMESQSFNSARKILRGIEAMNMIRKEQVEGIEQEDSISHVKFIEALFGIAA
jgi:IS6 family transposase